MQLVGDSNSLPSHYYRCYRFRPQFPLGCIHFSLSSHFKLSPSFTWATTTASEEPPLPCSPPHLRPSPPPGLRAVPAAAPAGGAAVFNPCRAPTCTRPGPGLRDGEVRQLAPLRTGCSGLALTEAGRDEGEEGKPEEWRRMSLARCLQRVNTRN